VGNASLLVMVGSFPQPPWFVCIAVPRLDRHTGATIVPNAGPEDCELGGGFSIRGRRKRHWLGRRRPGAGRWRWRWPFLAVGGSSTTDVGGVRSRGTIARSRPRGSTPGVGSDEQHEQEGQRQQCSRLFFRRCVEGGIHGVRSETRTGCHRSAWTAPATTSCWVGCDSSHRRALLPKQSPVRPRIVSERKRAVKRQQRNPSGNPPPPCGCSQQLGRQRQSLAPHRPVRPVVDQGHRLRTGPAHAGGWAPRTQGS
jgi:hypothetical protein